MSRHTPKKGVGVGGCADAARAPSPTLARRTRDVTPTYSEGRGGDFLWISREGLGKPLDGDDLPSSEP